MVTDKFYDISCKLNLLPVCLPDKNPLVNVNLFGKSEKLEIFDDTTFEYTGTIPQGINTISVEFMNKTINDTYDDKDLAVVVDNLEICGISDDKLKWQGVYCPKYPAHYLDEALKENKTLESNLYYVTYLGWNGRWELTIESPVYSWLHKVLDFGTIYPNI